METFESGLKKLDVFKNIHALEACDDDESTSLESVSVANDDSLSFIDVEEEITLFCKPQPMKKCENDTNQSLNTSIGSFEDSAAEATREDSDTNESSTGSFYNIASQMKL